MITSNHVMCTCFPWFRWTMSWWGSPTNMPDLQAMSQSTHPPPSTSTSPSSPPPPSPSFPYIYLVKWPSFVWFDWIPFSLFILCWFCGMVVIRGMWLWTLNPPLDGGLCSSPPSSKQLDKHSPRTTTLTPAMLESWYCISPSPSYSPRSSTTSVFVFLPFLFLVFLFLSSILFSLLRCWTIWKTSWLWTMI